MDKRKKAKNQEADFCIRFLGVDIQKYLIKKNHYLLWLFPCYTVYFAAFSFHTALSSAGTAREKVDGRRE
jgi:hypothetical protein